MSSIPFLNRLPPDFLILRGTEPTSKSPAVPSLLVPGTFPCSNHPISSISTFFCGLVSTRGRPRSVADRLRDQRRDPGADPSLSLSFSPSISLFHFLFLFFFSFPFPLSFPVVHAGRALPFSSLAPRSSPVPRPPASLLCTPLAATPPAQPTRPAPACGSRIRACQTRRARAAPAPPRRRAHAHAHARGLATGPCATPPHALLARPAPPCPARLCPRSVTSPAAAQTCTHTPSPWRTAPATTAQHRLHWSPPRVTSPPTGAVDGAQRRLSSRHLASARH